MGSKDAIKAKKSSSVKALENSSSAGVSKGFWWAILAVLVIAIVVVGYIWWDGKRAAEKELAEYPVKETSMTVNYDEASKTVLLASPKATKDTPTLDLWEDFSCHYCSQLAVSSDEAIKKAIEAGDLKFRIHTLNFMDQGDNEGQSTSAGQTVFAVAKSGNAKAYWNLRTMFMEKQQDLFNWDMDKFATAAKVFGADADTVDKIKDSAERDAYVDAAKAGFTLLSEVSDSGQVGTPAVYRSKEKVDVSAENWVEKEAKKAKGEAKDAKQADNAEADTQKGK